VTDELGLPSKGAASKRFSRLPGKYEISMEKTGSPSPAKKATKASGDSPEAEAEDTPKKTKAKPKPKKTPSKKSPSKKRKLDEAEEDDEVVKSEVESDN
jgi:hypothetical protein